MQTIVADSSSLIYLSKVALLPLFSRIVYLVISPHVYKECTGLSLSDDARQIKNLVRSKDIVICPVPRAYQLPISNLGTGEKSSIELWYFLDAASVIIDDKKGIQACKMRKIPFFCAILVPGMLQQNHMLSGPEEVDIYIDKICRIARYSQWIIDYAREHR